MSLLVIDNVNVAAQKGKQSISSCTKICRNCGEALSGYERKQLCSGACRQERNVRLRIALRAYKNLKQNL